MMAKSYRLYPYNFTDWRFLKDLLKMKKPPRHKDILRAVQQMQMDFFKALFQQNTVISHYDPRSAALPQTSVSRSTDIVVFRL